MKSRSLLWSVNYAIEGVVYTLRTQRNMRIHVGAAISVIIAALMLHVDKVGVLAIVLSIGLVIVTELVNTAIEATVDIMTDRYDPMAKIAKDVAASAVLVSAAISLVVAYLTLFDPLRAVAKTGLHAVRLASPTLTVAALGLTLIVVLILKAASREGTFVHGGWPSGHTALAFAAAAVLGFVTMSASAFVLACFIALLVAQSRVETETHTVAQVLLGAMLGLLIVTAIFQVFFR